MGVCKNQETQNQTYYARILSIRTPKKGPAFLEASHMQLRHFLLHQCLGVPAVMAYMIRTVLNHKLCNNEVAI